MRSLSSVSLPSPAAASSAVLPLTFALGALIGTGTVLGKGVMLAGVSPLALLLWLQAATAAGLLVWMTTAAEPLPRKRSHWRYGALLGLVSLAGPSAIGFVVMPRIGAGTYAAMFTLSPLCTFALRWTLVRTYPGHTRLAGLLVGGLGAWGLLWIGLHLAPGQGRWLALALLTPLLLATGNLVRERLRPPDASDLQLAVVQPLTQLAWLVPLCAATGVTLAWPHAPWTSLDGILLAQVALSIASAPLFFRLQARADAIALSQIGYVAVVAGSAVAALLYRETPSVWMTLALALLFAGMRLVGRGPVPSRP